MNNFGHFCKTLARSTGLCVFFALSACSQLPWQIPPSETSIEQLLQQRRYVTALKVLDSRKYTTLDYAEKRAAILAEIKQYQSELLRQADALMQQQQFAKAEALLEADRAELPASRELTQFDAQFTAARDRYLQRWLDDIVQQRAPALLKERNAYQALSKASNTPELQRAIERHRADVDYFTPLIAKLGAQALAQNDNEKAAQLLATANQLQPSPELARQLKAAEQAIASNRQKQKTARTNIREQRYAELLNALQKSIHDREFFAARDLLAQTRTLNIHTEELDLLNRNLEETIALFASQKVDVGNRDYTEGRIEDALDNWRTANALIPSAELQEKIDKAQKFIDRLEKLQKNQR